MPSTIMAAKTQSPKSTAQSTEPSLTWPSDAQMVGLHLTLSPAFYGSLPLTYPVGLHAWLLRQVQHDTPDLSAQMHDNPAEKNFSISRLQGLENNGQTLSTHPDQTYQWYLNGFSRPFTQWLAQWLTRSPQQITLYDQPLKIEQIAIALPATTYSKIWSRRKKKAISLSFLTPTSFRRQGHHYPLPNPTNLFNSYLRRWNQFAHRTYELSPFLDWIDQHVLIARHELSTARTTAGKKGLFTGFLGSLELRLDPKADGEYEQLFHALCRFAPYCGTGHKTTFGLGFTQSGWTADRSHYQQPTIAESALSDRIQDLSDYFLSLKKRQGGERGRNAAELWATVYARRERGESLVAIADDLELPYDSIKTYNKLANRAIRTGEISW